MSELYVNKTLGWKEKMGPTSPYWKSISATERRAAGTHCGPADSYPLGPGCNHVASAFTLAMSGHGSPSMSCIRNYARTHGCAMPVSQKAIQEMLNIKQGW